MESSHLVIFSTSGKFITKFNVVRWMSLSETLFWTGARGRIPITLTMKLYYSLCIKVNVVENIWTLWFAFRIFCVASLERFVLVRISQNGKIL